MSVPYEAHSVFKRELNEYHNNLNPIKHYLQQASTFLSKRYGLTKAEALNEVKSIIKEKGLKDPVVTYYFRDDNGDIEKATDTLSGYIKDVIETNRIIAPSFTVYKNPEEHKSIHAKYLHRNVALRKADKKAAHKYEQLGDVDKASYYDVMQKTRKIANNSLSGAYASASTILYNPSAHYTLTSVTRCMASIGNAVTETVVNGNKHLRNPDIVYNFITSIITEVHLSDVEQVMTDYKLHYPTPNEVMESILYSTRNYWEDKVKENEILQYLSKLSPVELAAILYTNDLYHLRKYNEEFVRELLYEMSKKVNTGSTDEVGDIVNAPEGIANLAHHICAQDIKGMEVDYEKMQGTPTLSLLAGTCNNITTNMVKHRKFFRTFFTSNILPISMAYIKDMLRDAIVLSDTDSTCGAYDTWVHWYYGNVKFSEEAVGLAATVMTINTQVMDHAIKIFARNMNISASAGDMLKMKNEYFWTVFVATNVSKHYFADTLIKEGNVYGVTKLELKGVHLIASAIDQDIVSRSQALIKEFNRAVSNNEPVDIRDYIDAVADIEIELLGRIKNGDVDIYKRDKIKEPGAYKIRDVTKNAYLHHILWMDVFASKYGDPGNPTYGVVKVPTMLDSKTKLNNYINNIDDPDIKSKFKAFIAKYKKEAFGTFRPPVAIVAQEGIPKEIIAAIDIERIVLDSCNQMYMFLESIGFYRVPSMLIHEMGYGTKFGDFISLNNRETPKVA